MSDERIKPPTVDQYNREVRSVMAMFSPQIYPCKKCKWPVADGCCCTTCGTDNSIEED